MNESTLAAKRWVMQVSGLRRALWRPSKCCFFFQGLKLGATKISLKNIEQNASFGKSNGFDMLFNLRYLSNIYTFRARIM